MSPARHRSLTEFLWKNSRQAVIVPHRQQSCDEGRKQPPLASCDHSMFMSTLITYSQTYAHTAIDLPNTSGHTEFKHLITTFELFRSYKKSFSLFGFMGNKIKKNRKRT